MVNHVAFFAPYTEHVGTEGTMLKLASYFTSQGIRVDLLRTYREWPTERSVDGRIVELDTRWSSAGIDALPFPWKKLFLGGVTLPRLTVYLRRKRPDVLVAGLLTAVAVGARNIAGVDTKVVATIQGLPQYDRLRKSIWPVAYPLADGVVAPVSSIAERTADISKVPLTEIRVIPNPVVTQDIIEWGSESPDHPWFEDDVPVVVAVGRQTRQKDFATLLRAHAHLREERYVRLVIPGKPDEKTDELLSLRDRLGIADSVDFPGFVENPYAYMAAADVFVLSSIWEGPGHVLVEALALGTPVVATNCPCGPRELLNDGEAGMLVPVANPQKMASAIAEVLDDENKRRQYATAGPRAAAPFQADRASEAYLAFCREIVEGAQNRVD